MGVGGVSRESYHVEKKFFDQLVTSATRWGVVACSGKNAGLISYACPRHTEGRGTEGRVLGPLVMSAMSAGGEKFSMVMSALEWWQ